jgi:predicted nucleic acid-binding protein
MHPSHGDAMGWIDAMATGRVKGLVTVHALAEVWSVLTKLPIHPRIDPAAARKVVGDIASIAQVVALTHVMYFDALDRCVSHGARSGAVFDALHLAAAERTGADVVLTFNEKDFVRLAQPESPRILSPHHEDARAMLANLTR